MSRYKEKRDEERAKKEAYILPRLHTLAWFFFILGIILATPLLGLPDLITDVMNEKNTNKVEGYVFIGMDIICLLFSILSFFAWRGLLRKHKLALWVAMFFSVFMLLLFPLGTIIGIYCLLTISRSRPLFEKKKATATADPS